MKKLTTRLLCLFLTCFLLNLWGAAPAFTEEVSGKKEASKGSITPHIPQKILSEELKFPENGQEKVLSEELKDSGTSGQGKSWLGKNKWWVLLGIVAVAGGAAAVGGGDSGGGSPSSPTGAISATW